jgi:hypothetical protein
MAACGGDSDEEPAGDAPSEITGTVISVQTQGLTEVSSFVVSEDDRRYTIQIDEGTELAFPPAHLNEHRLSGDPVRVELEGSLDDLVAVSIEDG